MLEKIQVFPGPGPLPEAASPYNGRQYQLLGVDSDQFGTGASYIRVPGSMKMMCKMGIEL
jgi:hypothetical protein